MYTSNTAVIAENPYMIKKLFNGGILEISTAERYSERGFQIICRNGKVEEIVLPFDGYPEETNEYAQ